MCEWCEENGGNLSYCQNCGRGICWDCESGTGDDVITRPYVTASGDVYCVSCGTREDQAEQDALDEEGYYFDDYSDNWYDPDMDLENEESNGAYIGPGNRTDEFYADMDAYFSEGDNE